MTEPTRTPYCTKIRYGICGAPLLAEDEMDGSHAPGIGVQPKLIELIYSAARDGKPASVSASVTGAWTRFGEPAGGEVAVHFKNGPDGWPAWLAEEARLHDPAPAGVAPATGAGLREAIRRVLAQCAGFDFDSLEPHDYQIQAAAIEAVLPVSAGQADRAAEEHRLALSEALGLGTGAPWAAIRERAAELAAVPAPSAVAGHTGSERERVKHSGPNTKFCVGCLSGEHERVDDEPAAGQSAGGTPQDPAVQHAPGIAVLCPDCRTKGYAICMDDKARQACACGQPGCEYCDEEG